MRLHPSLNRLYFASDNQGDGKYDIFYRNLETDQINNLTKGFSGRSFGQHEISPNGKVIAYIRDSSKGQEIHAFSPDEKNHKQLTNSGKRKKYLNWYLSSNKLVYVLNNNHLMLYDFETSKSDKLLSLKGKFLKWPSFSPDGSKISFASLDKYGLGTLNIYDLNSKQTSEIGEVNKRYISPQWLNENTLLYRENTNDEYLLKTFALKTKKENSVGPKSGVVYNTKLKNSNELVFLHSDLDNPLSLVNYNLETEESKRLRFDKINSDEIVKPDRLLLTFDDKKFPLYMYKPANFESARTYPLILWLHGTHGAFSPRWHTYSQFFAHSGYAFAVVNYAEILLDKSNGKIKSETTLQLGAVETSLSYLKEQKFIDNEQIYLLGVSMGTNVARTFLKSNARGIKGLIEYSPISVYRGSRPLPTFVAWGEKDPGLKSYQRNSSNTPNKLILRGEGHDLRNKQSIISRLKKTLSFCKY